MTENSLHNDTSSRAFPFETICNKVAQSLADELQKLERLDSSEPRSGFAAALNTVLVWCGARNTALPPWSTLDADRAYDFIDFLNKLPERCAMHGGHIDKIFVLQQLQTNNVGLELELGFIVRRNNPRIIRALSSPISEQDTGRALEMYNLNVYYFANGNDNSDKVFSIWESGSGALLYAEIWNPDRLTSKELQEFLKHCEKKVNAWNTAMENLGLIYRFHGSLERFFPDSPWEREDITSAFYVESFFGVKQRAKRSTIKRQTSCVQSPMCRPAAVYAAA